MGSLPLQSPTLRDDRLRPWKPRQCENCRASQDALQCFRVEGQGTFWRCANCNLFQKGFPIPSQFYDDGYHSHYLHSHARKVRAAEDRLDQLLGLAPQHSPRLLDIGSSVGAFMEAAERFGWRPYGVDVSREAVDHCRDRGLLCQHYDGFRLPFPSLFFDVVTAWHVIEHVPCVRTALDEWFRVLRPGGVLALETPAADCWKARLLGPHYRKFWPLEHTYTFTRDTMASFLWDAGFEIIAPRTTVPAGGASRMFFATLRRLQLGVTRYLGASKSFTVYARRPMYR